MNSLPQAPTHDVFISYAHADSTAAGQLVAALTASNLKVWLDESEIPTFGAIAQRIAQGLAKSKAFLAYYSKTYPARRACQYELTAAFIAAQTQGLNRLLVVNPETSDSHIQPIELRNTKYLAGPVTPTALAAGAAAIAGHLATISGPFGEPAALAPPKWVPIRGTGSTRFVGRIDKMWEVHSSLHDDQAPFAAKRISPGIAQITGLGGVGKSLLAEEYALRFGAAYPAGIFWLRAFGSESTGAVDTARLDGLRIDQLSAIAAQSGLPPAGSPAELENALRRYFEEKNQCGLWVVDDLPSGLQVDQVRSWFAPHPVLKTLITTRSREYSSLAAGIDLGVLPEEDAYALLTSRLQPRGDEEASAARSAVHELGAHALALDVAGAALTNYEGQTPFGVFLRELEIPNRDSLELASDLADTLPNGHEKSIAATLLGGIRSASEAARDVLRLASLLAPAPIPESFVVLIPDGVNGAYVKDRALMAFRLAARDLQRFSLAEKQEDSGWLVHPLIARAMRYVYGKDPRTQALLEPALNVFCTWLSDRRSRDLPAGIELAHAARLAAAVGGYGEINLLQLIASQHEVQGSFGAAEAEWRAILSRLEAIPHSEQVLLGMQNNLAVTLRKAGNAKEARDIQVKILQRKQELLGPKHQETITSLDNLGATLAELGDFEGAIDKHGQAVNLYSEVLGPRHPDTMVAVSNLASALRRAGRLQEAFELNTRLLKARTEVLGPNHPATLRAVEAVGVTLRELGQSEDALPLLKSAAEALARVRGPDDPLTLSVRQNMAVTLLETSRVAEGRASAAEVFESRRRVLGATHPDTLVTLETLNDALTRSGDLEQSRHLQSTALDALNSLDSSLGPRHPRTTAWAWSVYQMIEGDSRRRTDAVSVVDKYLVWLLTAPPAALEAGQQAIRNQFAQTSDGIYRRMLSRLLNNI